MLKKKIRQTIAASLLTLAAKRHQPAPPHGFLAEQWWRSSLLLPSATAEDIEGLCALVLLKKILVGMYCFTKHPSAGPAVQEVVLALYPDLPVPVAAPASWLSHACGFRWRLTQIYSLTLIAPTTGSGKVRRQRSSAPTTPAASTPNEVAAATPAAEEVVSTSPKARFHPYAI